jgi:hypothetical protein
MVLQPALAAGAQRILSLARRDRGAAERAIAALGPDEQLALVCEAPLARRAELLELLPEPERVVPRIPQAELCFTLKAIGLADSAWILALATPEQVVACVDLDAWSGMTPDRAVLDAWIDALAESGSESFLRALRALDPEIVVLHLRHRIAVQLAPGGSDPDWQPPPGAQTLDGQFWFSALREGDDLDAIVQMLRELFERDYWSYFRMLQGVVWELDTENEEWALRWRTGRLEDLGFPVWEEAMRIYGYLRPEQRAEISEHAHPLDVAEWHLPVWIPRLPAGPEARHAIFRAIEQLGAEERRACFYAFVAVANTLAVADGMPLGDAESTPRAIEKVARFASDGLEFVARERGLAPAEVLRRVPIERLFRVGANLDPQAAKVEPRVWSAIMGEGPTQAGPAGEPTGPVD